MLKQILKLCAVLMLGLLLACGNTQAPAPVVQFAPAATTYTTSFVCEDGNTPVQNAVCTSQQLATLDMRLAAIYRQHLGTDSIFERDQILATQRKWLLGLQSACNVHGTGATTSPATVSCLAMAYQAQIAGSHGNASGPNPQGGMISVDVYRAALYGGYQTRARSITLSGAPTPLLGPDSVGSYVMTLPNGGGRFGNFASQTGDYGDIDVFVLNGQLVALLTDVIGYNSPAPPGEAAARRCLP